ncbi:unnamed protein product [Cyprideis torosa]|uniref:MIP18 family-like domain-containing protein n=1 Tax=Cyprideis torosa TaxID=163714 RepID=A0A7R8ZLC9_9CRUS|nr:unnamed protein product [Cyprideis torosa]CAG0883382.1 unnamed protein product [Cyprideis torosa]
MAGMDRLENLNPKVYSRKDPRGRSKLEELENVRDPFDAREVFDMIRDIGDPEHPLTLEELNVVSEEDIHVDDAAGTIVVRFTPTIPHCSMATLIGLSIRVKLLRCLPSRFKVSVEVNPGSHASDTAINKQLNDKERVCAALENTSLIGMVNGCLAAEGS